MENNQGLNLQDYILGEGVFNKTKFKVISSEVAVSTEPEDATALLKDNATTNQEKLMGFDLCHLLRTTLTTDKYVYSFFMKLRLSMCNVQSYKHCKQIDRLLLYPEFSVDKQIIEQYPTSLKAVNGHSELHDVVMWLVECDIPAKFERGDDSTIFFHPYDSIQEDKIDASEFSLEVVMKPSRARRGLMNREIQMRYALVNHFNEILRSEKYKEGRESLLDAVFSASQTGTQNATLKITEFMNALS